MSERREEDVEALRLAEHFLRDPLTLHTRENIRIVAREVARLSGERDDARKQRDYFKRETKDAEAEVERLQEVESMALSVVGELRFLVEKLDAALSAGADRDTRDATCTCAKNAWNPDCPRHGRNPT